MKTFLLMCICSMALATGVFAQTPAGSPGASASATVSASASPESALEKSIRDKHKRHFKVTVGGHDLVDSDAGEKSGDRDRGNHDDIPAMVIPLVGIIFLSVFGAPVLIVAVILYFGFSKSRMQHRTVKMLVEKGQPVPPELLAPPPPAQRQRSDMRRGVVLSMVGLGLMVFLGAVNDWEGGTWAIGIIPLLIGAGYILVWKLEGGKAKADNPPRVP